jgi:hypothetical protein
MNEEPIPDDQPFNSPDRTDEELVEYDKGVRVGLDGEPIDDTKTEAWRRGWVNAQE